jgi:hypothetical protein
LRDGGRVSVAHVSTVAFVGIEAREVDVQVHMVNASADNARMSVVGLPDKAVAESRERVRAALHAIGLALPQKRITVNLSPADLPKEGSHYDVPIALALLTATEVLPSLEMATCLAMGELSLDGTIVPVAGVLPAAIKALELQRTFICKIQVLCPQLLRFPRRHYANGFGRRVNLRSDQLAVISIIENFKENNLFKQRQRVFESKSLNFFFQLLNYHLLILVLKLVLRKLIMASQFRTCPFMTKTLQPFKQCFAFIYPRAMHGNVGVGELGFTNHAV